MARQYKIKNRKEYNRLRHATMVKMWKDPQYRAKQSVAQTKANLRSWKDPKVRACRIKGLIRGQRASYADPIKGPQRVKRVSIGKAAYFAHMSQDERSTACAHWYQASFNTKKNTSLEKVVQSLLRKAKVRFKGHKRIGRFVPDIFIRPNVCVFVDGKYWHCRPERIQSDRRITKKLKKEGYIVIRLSEAMIQKFPNRCISMIKERL